MNKRDKFCYFRKEKKEEFLDGRKIAHVAKEICRSRDGINMILNGRIPISEQMKQSLLKYKRQYGDTRPENYYFYESETGGKKI